MSKGEGEQLDRSIDNSYSFDHIWLDHKRLHSNSIYDTSETKFTTLIPNSPGKHPSRGSPSFLVVLVEPERSPNLRIGHAEEVLIRSTQESHACHLLGGLVCIFLAQSG